MIRQTKYKIGILLIVGLPLMVGILAFYIYWQIPSEKTLRGCFTTTMNSVALCPGSRNYVSLKRIAPVFRQAVLLSEDSLFFQHKGFDWESIEKSAMENWEKGQYKRGGSTITQQLAKNLFLNKNKTLVRKLMEGLITLKIENTLTKNEIFERYLNVIEFGKGIYGVKAAAQHYFQKAPSDLTAAESAFLAMLLPNPVKYSVSFKKKELTKFAKNRVQKILHDLYQYHRIDQATYEAGVAQVPWLFSPQQVELLESGGPSEESSEEDEFSLFED